MRRLPVAAFLVLMMSLPSALVSQVLVGALAGINNTSLSGDALPNTSYTSQLGFSASAVVDMPLGDDIRLSLQPGYAHLGTGIAMTSALHEPRDTLNVSMDYVILPVLGRVLARNGVTYATGGLQAAMLVNAASAPASGGASRNIGSAIADFDIAFIIGAGAQIPLSSSLLTVEIRYTQSLMNASRTEEAAEAFQMPPRFRLTGLQLNAGILFAF